MSVFFIAQKKERKRVYRLLFWGAVVSAAGKNIKVCGSIHNRPFTRNTNWNSQRHWDDNMVSTSARDFVCAIVRVKCCGMCIGSHPL